LEEQLLYEPLSLQEQRLDGLTTVSLTSPASIHTRCRLESLEMMLSATVEDFSEAETPPQRFKHSTRSLQFRLEHDALLQTLKQSILGGGLSNLKLEMEGVVLKISGVLTQDGRRSAFWMRGFFLETLGDFGGFVFTDLLFLGVPSLPSPALVSLLASRVGMLSSMRVHGAVQIHVNPLSPVLKWSLVPSGWKIPSYRNMRLQELQQTSEGHLIFTYTQAKKGASPEPLARLHPAYRQVETTLQSEAMFVQGEAQIRRGNYQAAIQLYEQELRNHPRHPFVQERLMQLYIASRETSYWQGAYRLAEDLLNRDSHNLVALNCAAQYGEVTGDQDTAIYFMSRLAEVASQQGLSTLAALSFAKAAMMLESKDPQQALIRWHASRKQDPTYSPANSAIARHAIKQKNYEEAETVLKELIELLPEGAERSRHHLSLAGLYRSHFRDLSRARVQLEHAKPHLGEDLAFLRESAEFHLAQREDFEAIRLLDMLAERVRFIHDPNLLAMILARTGQVLEERLLQPGMALYRYREALKYAPHHAAIQRRVQRLESQRVAEEALPTNGQALIPLQIHTLEQKLSNEELDNGEQAELFFSLSQLHWQQRSFTLSFKNGVRAVQKRPLWEEAWNLLEEIAAESQQLPALASVHRKVAQFSRDPLRAMFHLEESLRLIPGDKNSRILLAQLYSEHEVWTKLLDLYGDWEVWVDGPEKTELLLRKAVLLDLTLERYTQAEEAYIEVCESTPEPLSVLSYLFQFYIQQKEFYRFELQYGEWLDRLPVHEHARFHAILASLLRRHPEHHRKALDLYLRALELEPNNDGTLRAVLELAQESDDEQNLTLVLEQMSERLQHSENTIPLLLELLRLLEEETGAETRIRDVCRHILQLNPNEARALRKLAEVERRLGATHDAIAIQERLLELTTTHHPAPRFEVLEELLDLYGEVGEEEKLLRAAAEFVHLFPDFARPDLEQSALFAGSGQSLAVSRFLLVLGQRWRNARYFLYIANILRKTHPEASAVASDLGLEVDPLHPDLWRGRLRNVSTEQRQKLWQRLLHEVERLKATSTDSASWQGLFSRWNADDFSLQELEQLFDAFQAYGRFPPSVIRLFSSRLESEEQFEKSQRVREYYLHTLVSGSEEYNQLQYELAIHQVQLLHDRPGGLQRLWELVEVAPSFRDPLLELKYLYETEEQLDEYVARLESLLQDRLHGVARADLLVQAFEILLESRTPEEILVFLQQLQAQMSDDSVSLQALSALYEELSEYQAAAELYKEAAVLVSEEESVWFFEKAALLFQQSLDRPDESLDLYQKILEIQPEHELARTSLRELYSSLWMWDELATLLEQEIEQESHRERKIQRLCDLGEIYLGRLEDYDRALDTYRAALRQNPRNPEVLHTLRALYEEIDDWPAVCAAIKLLAKIETDPSQASSYYLQVAELALDRLYKLEEAERYNLMAYEADPSRQEPVLRLLDLYDASGNFEALARLTAQLAVQEVGESQHDAASQHLDRMLLALEQLSPPPEPAEWFTEALQETELPVHLRMETTDLLNTILNPFDASADRPLPLYHQVYDKGLTELGWLLRLDEQLARENSPSNIPPELAELAAEESWQQLARLLDALDERNPSDELAGHYTLAAAQIHWVLFQSRRDALSLAKRSLLHGTMPERPLSFIDEVFIREGIEIDPRKTRLLVDKITSPELQRRACFHMAHDAIEKMGQWQWALDALHLATGLSVDPVLQKSVDLLERGQLREAVSMLNDFLEQEAEHLIALRFLGAAQYLLAEMEDAAYPLYRFLELAWADLPYPEVVELCLQLAQISDSRNDMENALFYLQQASQFIPEEPRILDMQVHLLTSAGLHDDLRMLLYSHIEEPEPSDDMADLWFQLGRLEEEQYQNQREAQKCYERVLFFAPEHEAARNFFQNLSDSTRSELSDPDKGFTFKV
jgi:tetratricopeptide (TPR) repeat protein